MRPQPDPDALDAAPDAPTAASDAPTAALAAPDAPTAPASAGDAIFAATPAPDAPTAPDDGFAALGLLPALLGTLASLGYEEPTPIQRAAIPPLLEGRDLLAEAPTGTGKTAAFTLPILQRLAAQGLGRAGQGSALALILVPTRELAMQVAQAVHRYGRDLRARVLPVYGGQPIGQQLRGLRGGLDVVVATPGRAVDHLNRGSLRLDAIEAVILDEADEMLDMGFADDLDAILATTPPTRQTALFSATISPTIARVAARHLHDPVRVSVRPDRVTPEAPPRVRQVAYVVRGPDKLAALGRILDVEDPSAALVFGRTRGEVDDLAQALSGRGHDAAALHGGMSQEQRDRVMARFRDGSLDVLVATDVAARGLDIEHVSHVVNFDVPSSPDAYIHRIGRTGRAGREGVAITLVEPREHRLLQNIEAASRVRLERASLPTVADLRERRLDALQAALRERAAAPGLDHYRGVAEALADEYDAMEIALAALALLDATSTRGDDEVEIPAASLPGARLVDGHVRGRPGSRRPLERPAGPDRGEPRSSQGPWVRLYVGAGRRAGMRPADLVGAITAEAGVPGSTIGAIQIADTFSLVDVERDVAEDVVLALRGATVRGRSIPVRLDRGPGAVDRGDPLPQRAPGPPARGAPQPARAPGEWRPQPFRSASRTPHPLRRSRGG